MKRKDVTSTEKIDADIKSASEERLALLNFWWRRGRDGLHLLKEIPSLLLSRNALVVSFLK